VISSIVAHPLELQNFYIFGFPIDVVLPPDTPFIHRLLAYQWVFVHLPGLWILGRLNWKVSLVPVLSLTGYIDTATAVLACVILFRWMRNGVRKESPGLG
jgi:hypothetical protein